jgi:hypothetical protein
MISFRMIAMMAVVALTAACWPRGAQEVETVVEEVEVVEEQITDAVTDVGGGSDELELEIIEEVQ